MKRIDYKCLISNERSYFILYIMLFSAFCLYNLFRWPVSAGDTDLWYHLNGGRYFFDHHSIPQDSFFSFIVPARKWVDYYWLFQVFVYKIHAYLGYYGLIYLRALLFMGLIFFVFRYFTRDLYERKSHLSISLVFSLYSLILLSRYATIRPHMFSYLFIVLFLYILEYRQKMVFMLPLLALLWVNIHGVVYPVMLLITLAYLSEFVVKRIKEKAKTDKENIRVIIPLVLTLCTVYCTPHGIRLLGMPLTPTNFASLYIIELQKFAFADLSSLCFTNFVPTLHTLFVVVLVLAFISCIHIFTTPSRRIAHFILFAGGLVLLTRGKRFGFEFILLAMPVIKDALFSINMPMCFDKEKKILAVRFVFIFFLSIVSLFCLYNIFKNLPKFPISYAQLPHGVVTFLQKVNAGGKILNDPNTGGYLQWALHPKYMIFMDMEVPFLFKDEDMNFAKRVFTDHQTFNKILIKYDPAFISVPVNIQQFQEIINKYPQFKPVFFDDKEALYVNEKYHPLIVEEYFIKYIDPMTFPAMSFSDLINHPNLGMVLSELERINGIDPDIGLVNRSLSVIYRLKGEYPRAILHAETLIRDFPESEIGYALKGDTLKELRKYNEALESYRIALKKAVDKKALFRAMGMIYFEQGRCKKAYDNFLQGIDIYAPATSYRDLYYIIYSATKANLKREALFFWRYGMQMLPTDDLEWNRKYEELRAMLNDSDRK